MIWTMVQANPPLFYVMYIYDNMRNACRHVGIISKHFVHFGRSASSVQAELDELDGNTINDLGKWNVDTRRNVFSDKLPLKAMRVMAGHPDEKEVLSYKFYPPLLFLIRSFVSMSSFC